jgi:soluble lytic murein transglycosylase
MQGTLVAGVVAAMLGLAAIATLARGPTSDVIDPVTTSALAAPSVAVPVAKPAEPATAPAPVVPLSPPPTPATVTQTAALPDAVSNLPMPEAEQPRPSSQFRALLARVGDEPAEVFDDAAELDSAIERDTLRWAVITYAPGRIAAEDIDAFATAAPDFLAPDTVRTRVEQSLLRARSSDATMIEALGDTTPVTLDAQIRLAQALLETGETDRAMTLARSVWTENFLSTEQEAEVAETLGSLLDRDAHWHRAMHLMMHDRARGSERLIPHLSPAQVTLVEARAAVSRNDADAKELLDSVDPSMQDNPVYIFSRVQRARQFELWESAVDWLDKASGEVPDSAEWWYERRTLVRKLLDLGEPELAWRAASGYRDGPEARMVDAHFHAGFIALSFLDDAEAAREQFSELTAHTTLPDSIAQANYWLGRAEMALGNADAARVAFTAAAAHPTVYYGLLARAELGETDANIRPLPDPAFNGALFEGSPVTAAIRLLAASGERNKAVALLRHHIDSFTTGGEFVLAARLAQELNAQNLAISIATIADQRGFPLDPLSFPSDVFDDLDRLATEEAAVFAVVRQESMFQIDAVSSAGARGLMQLMPGTAREVAQNVGVDYSPSRLVSDASYNTLLGSTYLETQLERYDGSLALAAAAYNAGPGNANKWIRAYGDPREENVDPVIWVELIPFQETRTYVKRVLGNYLVYRALLGEDTITMQQALRSIR